MAKTAKEIFNDKVSLIYEYDNQSPLFVRKANTEIEKNNLEPAVEILENGLKHYPDYATAYFILGKAQLLTGHYRDALQNFKTGSDLIHSRKTYEYYLNEIESIKKQRTLFETGKRNAFLLSNDEYDEEQQTSPEKMQEEDKSDYTAGNSVDDDMKQLAQKISNAKIPFSDSPENQIGDFPIDFSEDSMIVSETLAKIYITQGEFNEAISVYEKLMKKNPDKNDYYKDKIQELRDQIE